ncbi:hypothetical protein EV368DRAFT_64552 [Lentinula lateritia]|nr:hypothetical protein EV368DRAFT_64552 [Lentinula lateritia]
MGYSVTISISESTIFTATGCQKAEAFRTDRRHGTASDYNAAESPCKTFQTYLSIIFRKEKADEYNKAGTLTAIPATTKSIGEGAYLSPRLGEFPGKLNDIFQFGVVTSLTHGPLRTYWELFVDDQAAISAQPVKLLLYAHKKGFEIGKTLLFSRHFVFKGTLQMLIPPMFLIKSPSNPSRPAGTNSLGLRIYCTPLGGLGKNRPAADWYSWKIHNWPANITKT